MARSLDGTVWLCTDKNSEKHGAQAEITNGDYDPKWNGEQDIEIRYEDGTKDTMNYRQFRERFMQKAPVYAR